MAVGSHPVCARRGGATPVFGDSQMQDAVAARMGKRKASMACVCCVASVESCSGWEWDRVKLGRGHQTQRKAMKRTHAPLCPGPTRQSCRSRESLDSAAQSRAPDPRALATGYRLWLLFRDGVSAGVSLGSPVARLRQEARGGDGTKRCCCCYNIATEEKLARCQHYEASIGMSILARRTDKSKERDERDEREGRAQRR